MMKPVCRLQGENGNIFYLLGKVIRALEEAGEEDKICKVTEKILESSSYDEALQAITEFVEIE